MTAMINVPCGLCCVLGDRFLVPDIEGVRPDYAIVRGCELMSTGAKMAVNESVCEFRSIVITDSV